MNKSESISNLAKSLAEFQAEVKNPHNTAENPFFKSKYAPLPDILNDIRPLLAKHGLSVIQAPSSQDGQNIVITTLLMHSSGEWIETCPLVLKAEKVTAQGAGSAITYGRRYALSAVFGISSEDDDDGNHASKPEPAQQRTQQVIRDIKPPQQLEARPAEEVQKLTDAQMKRIYAMAGELKMPAQEAKKTILDRYKVDSTTKLTKANAKDLIDYLEEKKKGLQEAV